MHIFTDLRERKASVKTVLSAIQKEVSAQKKYTFKLRTAVRGQSYRGEIKYHRGAMSKSPR